MGSIPWLWIACLERGKLFSLPSRTWKRAGYSRRWMEVRSFVNFSHLIRFDLWDDHPRRPIFSFFVPCVDVWSDPIFAWRNLDFKTARRWRHWSCLPLDNLQTISSVVIASESMQSCSGDTSMLDAKHALIQAHNFVKKLEESAWHQSMTWCTMYSHFRSLWSNSRRLSSNMLTFSLSLRTEVCVPWIFSLKQHLLHCSLTGVRALDVVMHLRKVVKSVSGTFQIGKSYKYFFTWSVCFCSWKGNKATTKTVRYFISAGMPMKVIFTLFTSVIPGQCKTFGSLHIDLAKWLEVQFLRARPIPRDMASFSVSNTFCRGFPNLELFTTFRCIDRIINGCKYLRSQCSILVNIDAHSHSSWHHRYWYDVIIIIIIWASLLIFNKINGFSKSLYHRTQFDE